MLKIMTIVTITIAITARGIKKSRKMFVKLPIGPNIGSTIVKTELALAEISCGG
jgi:hypothetical protein